MYLSWYTSGRLELGGSMRAFHSKTTYHLCGKLPYSPCYSTHPYIVRTRVFEAKKWEKNILHI